MLRSLDHVPVGTVIYTEQRGVIMASAAFAEIVGYPLAEVYGKRMEDFTFEDDQPTSRWLLAAAIGNRLPFTLKKRYVRPGGEIVWVENHYQILETPAEDVTVCLLSRRLDALPPSPQIDRFGDVDTSDYVREMSLDLAALAHHGGREMAADVLRLAAKVSKID